MIAATDTLSFAPGVAFLHGNLSDAVRGDSWPLNGSGAFVAARIDTPVGQIVRDLADAFSVPHETARTDVLRFVWYLNGLALVNVSRAGSRTRRFLSWIRLAATLAPAGAVPAAVTRRRSIDTRSVGRAAVSTFVAAFSRIAIVAAIAALVAAPFSGFAGAWGLVVPLVLGLGTGVGLGVHEAAHAALLRGIPCALVLRGRRTSVLHAPVGPRRRSVVALAGPVVAVGLGFVLVAVGSVLTLPIVAVAGSPLVAHAFALTVVGGDGRVACGL